MDINKKASSLLQ